MKRFNYKKIIVIGNNGSGKSYFSKQLSELTGIPLIHLDMIYWRPEWTAPSQDEWIAIQKEIISQDKWIIDGNHTETLELRFKAAELIIFLDMNRFVCLLSVIKRLFEERLDSPQYLEYKFDKAFCEFCKRLWTFSKKRRPVIVSLHQKYSNKDFYLVKNRKELTKLLNTLKGELLNG